MVSITADVFRSRFKELHEQALVDICATLNDEYEERFYIQNNKIYVDCSDYSQRDVEIS